MTTSDIAIISAVYAVGIVIMAAIGSQVLRKRGDTFDSDDCHITTIVSLLWPMLLVAGLTGLALYVFFRLVMLPVMGIARLTDKVVRLVNRRKGGLR